MLALASKAARRLVSACLALTIAPLLNAAPALAQEAPPVTTGQGGDRFYCEERRLGYWFYCTRPKPADKPAATSPPAASATSQLDAITAELRELKAKAILEPTPANVTAYIRFQREQLDRASLFSDVWQRAIWQDPELDYTLQRGLLSAPAPMRFPTNYVLYMFSLDSTRQGIERDDPASCIDRHRNGCGNAGARSGTSSTGGRGGRR